MNGKLFLMSLFFTALFFGTPFDATAQNKSHNKTKIPKPVKTNQIKIAPPSKLENEIIEEINFARTKPVEYAKMLEELRKYYKGTAYNAPGRKTFRTIEGINSLNEAIEALKATKPLEPLNVNCAVVRSSRDHLADLQNSGAFSHFGSDGSSPHERLKKYLGGEFYSSENIVGRNGTVRDIVTMMLFDDGLPERPHRKNLLNPSFKFAGVSNGDNIKKMNLTVVVLSDSSADIEPCEMK